jgi:hypothetical protein
MENIITYLASKTQQQDLFLDTIADKFPDYDYSQLNEIAMKHLKNLNAKSLKHLKSALQEMSISDWFDEEKLDYIPSRYLIILFLLIMKTDVKDADEILKSSGHYGLNPRSIFDATVMFALMHKQELDDWFTNYVLLERELQCATARAMPVENHPNIVSLRSIREFIASQKETSNGKAITQKITQIVRESLEKVEDITDFSEFIKEHLVRMADHRVKSRYRLLIAIEKYMTQQVHHFISIYNQYVLTKSDDDWEQLDKAHRDSVLLGRTQTKGQFGKIIKTKSKIKKSISVQEFDGIRLSLKDFLVRYSEFYCQANFFNEDATEGYKTKNEREFEGNDDALDNENDVIGQAAISRSTINTFRDVLFGIKDPSRKLMITLLIFTGSQNIHQLNNILMDCGFDPIKDTRAFDIFITNFLNAGNKQEFLYQLDEELTKNKRFFFLDNVDKMVELPAKELKQKIRLR